MKLEFVRRMAGRKEPEPGKSISQKAKLKTSPGCAAGFFAVFLLAGLGFMLIFAIPGYRTIRAQAWSRVDCEVLSSGVQSHAGSDSTTYSIEVTYRYAVDGVEYTGDRYEFMGGSSSGYDGKKKKVDAMPPGAIVPCYVDPGDPSQSVMYRGFNWVYLFALMPLAFIVIGAGGIYFSLTAGSRKLGPLGAPRSQAAKDRFAEAATYSEPEPFPQPVGSGPIELEEQLSPMGKLGCLIFVALFWNGIVSVFVWQIWSEWRAGNGIEGCLAIFLIPFVLIGLVMLLGIPYQILALANPRPKLTLSRPAIALGESAQLSWSFKGSAGRLRDLRIWIEGVESATYRRGTSSHTSTETFAKLEVVRREQGMPLDTGSASIRLPIDTMHTFEGGRNKIQWKLKLHGSIVWWPDVITEFPLTVLPAEGDEE